MKKIIPLFMLFSVSLQAQHITHVTDFITDGPYEFQQPVPIDSVDVNGTSLYSLPVFTKNSSFISTTQTTRKQS